VPLGRSRQPQTQAHRSFGIDVREAATLSQGDEVGCQHPSVRMAVPPELDADLVPPRQRARLNRRDPIQPVRPELPPPKRVVVPEQQVLLGQRQLRGPAHELSAEECVGSHRDAAGGAGHEANPGGVP
jgi:hypothetical protein